MRPRKTSSFAPYWRQSGVISTAEREFDVDSPSTEAAKTAAIRPPRSECFQFLSA